MISIFRRCKVIKTFSCYINQTTGNQLLKLFSMRSELYHLVYVSVATENMNDNQLREIEYISQKNNAGLSVTGILMYSNKKFMQFIEGPKNNIIDLYKIIEDDPRHHGIDVIRFQSIPERQFTHWEMRMTLLHDISKNRGIIFEKLFKRDFMSSYAKDLAIESQCLLLAFKGCH